jgi:hypothetical protein
MDTLGFVTLYVKCSLQELVVWGSAAHTADGKNKSAGTRFPSSAILLFVWPQGLISAYDISDQSFNEKPC